MQILRILHKDVITNLNRTATNHPAERNAGADMALATWQRALRKAPFSGCGDLQDDSTDDKSHTWSKPSGIQVFDQQVLAETWVTHALLACALVNCRTRAGVQENHLTVAGPAVRVSRNAPFGMEVGADKRNSLCSAGGGGLNPCERCGHA